MPTARHPSGEEADSILKAKQKAPLEEGLMEKGIKGATEKYDYPCLTWFCFLDPLEIYCKSLNLEQCSGQSLEFFCHQGLKWTFLA